MIRKIRVVFVLIMILLFIFSSEAISSKDENLQNISQGYSTWVIHSSKYMTIKEKNNTLQGFYNRSVSNANKWLGAYAEIPIKQAVGLRINLDFQFNFKQMGEILLDGFDSGTNSSSWEVGYIDAWTGHAGVPLTFSYQAVGGVSKQSYPVNDAQRSQVEISSYYGKGHISIYYNSISEINATVTLPGVSLTRNLPLAKPMNEIRIYMQAVGEYNAQTDLWKTYNYHENTGITNFSYVNASSIFSPAQQSNDILFFVVIAGSIIVATIVIVYLTYNRNKEKHVYDSRIPQERQSRMNSNSNSLYQESKSDDLISSNVNICSLCGYKASPNEKFCRSCGSRLNN